MTVPIDRPDARGVDAYHWYGDVWCPACVADALRQNHPDERVHRLAQRLCPPSYNGTRDAIRAIEQVRFLRSTHELRSRGERRTRRWSGWDEWSGYADPEWLWDGRLSDNFPQPVQYSDSHLSNFDDPAYMDHDQHCNSCSALLCMALTPYNEDGDSDYDGDIVDEADDDEDDWIDDDYRDRLEMTATN